MSLKGMLCNCVILFVPSPTDELILHTDASGRGVGAVLSMVQEGEELPTDFYSRQLSGAELWYSVTEWVALAVVAAVELFHSLLFGRLFTVVTDHKALTSLIPSCVLNKRLQGWALKIASL